MMRSNEDSSMLRMYTRISIVFVRVSTLVGHRWNGWQRDDQSPSIVARVATCLCACFGVYYRVVTDLAFATSRAFMLQEAENYYQCALDAADASRDGACVGTIELRARIVETAQKV
jgi:hypothetical protein